MRLRRYYDFYPERFQRRTQASGLWLVSLPSLKDVPDPENYAFWQATRLKETPQAIQMGMEAYPYAIVGQRELGYLKKKVSSYEDVLAALETKPESTRRSRYSWEVVKPLVESSGLRDSSGHLIYRLRTTDWAGNSISFPMNPSPSCRSARAVRRQRAIPTRRSRANCAITRCWRASTWIRSRCGELRELPARSLSPPCVRR